MDFEVPAFRKLISPVTPETFGAEFWERQPSISKFGGGGCVPLDFSLSDFLEILAFHDLKNADVSMFKANQRYGHDAFQDPKARLRSRVVECGLRDGYTLRMGGLHRHHRALASYASQLAWELGASVQIVAYLTGPSCPGYDVHFDLDEIFIVQISGTRRWDMYEPELVLPTDAVTQRPLESDEAPHSAWDVAPGDVLHIPRGWRHGAQTQGEYSLHCSVEITPPSMLERASARLREVASQTEDMRRRPLPWEASAPLELNTLQRRQSDTQWSVRRSESFPSPVELPSSSLGRDAPESQTLFWRDGVIPSVELLPGGLSRFEVDGFEAAADARDAEVFLRYASRRLVPHLGSDGAEYPSSTLEHELRTMCINERLLCGGKARESTQM